MEWDPDVMVFPSVGKMQPAQCSESDVREVNAFSVLYCIICFSQSMTFNITRRLLNVHAASFP